MTFSYSKLFCMQSELSQDPPQDSGDHRGSVSIYTGRCVDTVCRLGNERHTTSHLIGSVPFGRRVPKVPEMAVTDWLKVSPQPGRTSVGIR